MRCSCTMTSSKDISPKEEEADANGVDWDSAKREEGAAKSVCHDRNWALLRLMLALSMAHVIVKWLEEGKGMEKWCKILVIAEGKISLSRDAESK